MITGALMMLPALALAGDSANYDMNQERGGPVEFDGSSTNYQFKAEVGHPGVGTSTSANYIYDHGTWWDDAVGTVFAVVQWAVPELRYGVAETNDDVTFILTVRTSDNSDDVILYTQSVLATSEVDGTYSIPIELAVAAGTYDIGIKTDQHLTLVLDDVPLIDGTTTLNFSQTDNSAPKGAIELIAGDINLAGDAPATLGDDKINALDITQCLTDFAESDATGNGYRSNLNQDTKVNALDLTTVLKNFNLEGDN